MSVISFSGLASGLDTGSWVTALTALKNAKIESLQEEKAAVVSLKDAVAGIKTYFTSFRNSLERLTDAKFGTDSLDLFVQNLANSSNPSKVTATATSATARDTYEVGVTQVATATKVNTAVRRTVTVTNTAAETTKLSVLGVKEGFVSINNKEVQITAGDTIGTLVEKLNDNGITSYYEEDKGRFTIATDVFEADDGITDLFDSLGLDLKDVVGEQTKQLMTEGYVAIKPTTLLADIGATDGQLMINQTLVNMNLGAGATVQDFLDYVNNNYGAQGATATMDADGYISITGLDIQEVAGGSNIVTQLGLVEKVDSVTSVTDGLSYIQTESIKLDTKLGEINTTFANYNLVLGTTPTGGATTALNANSTIEDVKNAIENFANANGMSVQFEVDEDGAISITGDIDKLYISGGVATGLGLDVEKVNGTSLTSSQLNYTHTLTAQTSTTWAELGISGASLTYNVLYERGNAIASNQSVGANTTIEAWFNSLKQYGIEGSISEQGVISIDGDGLISGGLATALGLGQVKSGEVISGTSTTSNALSGVVTVTATMTTTLGELGITSNQTFTIRNGGTTVSTTFTSTTKIQDIANMVEANGGTFELMDDGSITIKDIDQLSGSLVATFGLTASGTTGTSIYSNDATYSTGSLVTEGSKFSDYGVSVSGKTFDIYSPTGSKIASGLSLSSDATVSDLFALLNSYGLSTNITSDGRLSISDGYITGSLADTLGISNSAYNTIVAEKTMVSKGLSITVSTTATLDTTLSELGLSGSYSMTVNYNGTTKGYNFGASNTLADIADAVHATGGKFDLTDGYVSVTDAEVTGSICSAIGLNKKAGSVQTIKTEELEMTLKTMTITTTATATAVTTATAIVTVTSSATTTAITTQTITASVSATAIAITTITAIATTTAVTTATVSAAATVSVTWTTYGTTTEITGYETDTVATKTITSTSTQTITPGRVYFEGGCSHEYYNAYVVGNPHLSQVVCQTVPTENNMYDDKPLYVYGYCDGLVPPEGFDGGPSIWTTHVEQSPVTTTITSRSTYYTTKTVGTTYTTRTISTTTHTRTVSTTVVKTTAVTKTATVTSIGTKTTTVITTNSGPADILVENGTTVTAHYQTSVTPAGASVPVYGTTTITNYTTSTIAAGTGTTTYGTTTITTYTTTTITNGVSLGDGGSITSTKYLTRTTVTGQTTQYVASGGWKSLSISCSGFYNSIQEAVNAITVDDLVSQGWFSYGDKIGYRSTKLHDDDDGYYVTITSGMKLYQIFDCFVGAAFNGGWTYVSSGSFGGAVVLFQSGYSSSGYEIFSDSNNKFIQSIGNSYSSTTTGGTTQVVTYSTQTTTTSSGGAAYGGSIEGDITQYVLLVKDGSLNSKLSEVTWGNASNPGTNYSSKFSVGEVIGLVGGGGTRLLTVTSSTTVQDFLSFMGSYARWSTSSTSSSSYNGNNYFAINITDEGNTTYDATLLSTNSSSAVFDICRVSSSALSNSEVQTIGTRTTTKTTSTTSTTGTAGQTITTGTTRTTKTISTTYTAGSAAQTITVGTTYTTDTLYATVHTVLTGKVESKTVTVSTTKTVIRTDTVSTTHTVIQTVTHKHTATYIEYKTVTKTRTDTSSLVYRSDQKTHGIVSTTFNASDTTLNKLGVSNGAVTLKDEDAGTTKTILNVTSSSTLDDLITSLQLNGFDAKYEDGRIYLNTENNVTLGGVVSGLSFTTATTSVTFKSNSTSNAYDNSATSKITGTTTLGTFAKEGADRVIELTVDGTKYYQTFTASNTVNDVIDWLGAQGVTASINNGVFQASDSYHEIQIGGALGDVLLGDNPTVTSTTGTGGYWTGDIAENRVGVAINNDTKIVDLGVSTGGLKIYDNGTWINTAVYIGENTTIGDLASMLAGYDMTASLQGGKLVITSDSDKYLSDESSNLVSKLGLTNRVQSKVDIYDQTNSKTLTVVTTTTLSKTTTLGELGFSSRVSMRVEVDGVMQTMGFTSDETIQDVIDALSAYGIDANIHNGIFTAFSESSQFELTGSLADKLNGNAPTYLATEKVVSYSTDDIKTDVEYTAVPTTKLTQLGVKTGYFNVERNGEIIATVGVDENTTVQQMFNALSAYNIAGDIDANGVITVKSVGDIVISDGTSNLVSHLGLDDNMRSCTYDGTTMVLEDEVNFADRDTLVSYFDTVDKKALGSLYFEVADQEGNMLQTVVNITADDTIGSVMDKLEAIGLKVELKDGVLSYHNGLGSVNIVGGSSSLVDTLQIADANLEKWMQNTDSIMVEQEEIRYDSIVNYADNNTKLSTLGIITGEFTMGLNGQMITVDVDENDTLGTVISKISNKTGGRVTASLTDDGRFKLEANPDITLEFGLSIDSSNFVTILDLDGNGTNSVTGNTHLYRASDQSKITTAGLFRLGNVTEGTFKIGNATFTITNDTTIAQLVNEINRNEDANATAYWDNINGRLQLTSKGTGASYVDVTSGTSNFTEIFGLTVNDAGVEKLATYNQKLGNNAILTINGTRIVATSNTITSDISKIEGLTVNVKDVTAGEYVTIKVERNTQALVDAVQETLDNYNVLIAELNNSLSISGSFHGDVALNSIKNEMASILTASATNGASLFRNLASVGISTESANSVLTSDIYSLYLDPERFTKALEESEQEVKLLLVGTVDNPGILTKVGNILDNALSASGYFSTKTSAINRDIASYDKKIAKITQQTEAYKALLERKFNNMENLYSTMQAAYSNLSMAQV